MVAVQALSRRSGGAVGPPVSHGARRRRRVLLTLLVIAAALGAGSALHRLPWWAPMAGLLLAGTWFALGLFAARAGRRARRGHRRRVAHRERVSRERVGRERVNARGASIVGGGGIGGRPDPLGEPSWGSIPSVGIVARWGREDSETNGLDRQLVRSFGADPVAAVSGQAVQDGTGPDASEAVGARSTTGGVAMQPAMAVQIAPGAWQPVPVPVPTYVSAPLAPRTVASIPLEVAGSWTSASSPSGEQTAQILIGNPSRNSRPPVEVHHAATVAAEVRAPRHLGAEPPTDPAADQTAEVEYELPAAVGN